MSALDRSCTVFVKLQALAKEEPSTLTHVSLKFLHRSSSNCSTKRPQIQRTELDDIGGSRSRRIFAHNALELTWHEEETLTWTSMMRHLLWTSIRLFSELISSTCFDFHWFSGRRWFLRYLNRFSNFVVNIFIHRQYSRGIVPWSTCMVRPDMKLHGEDRLRGACFFRSSSNVSSS